MTERVKGSIYCRLMDQLLVYARKNVKLLNDAAVVAQVSHWNVRGPNYYESHLLFGRVYEDLSGLMDNFVENLRACGYDPDFAELSGPGISMQYFDAGSLVDLNLDYVMALNGGLTLFYNYCEGYKDDPRMVGLANLVQGMATSVLTNLYLLQAAKGH